tara:strand:+ start:1561 stop:2016 length:456 start_codon:yes stop_codon:yes gene_type:complete
MSRDDYYFCNDYARMIQISVILAVICFFPFLIITLETSDPYPWNLLFGLPLLSLFYALGALARVPFARFVAVRTMNPKRIKKLARLERKEREASARWHNRRETARWFKNATTDQILERAEAELASKEAAKASEGGLSAASIGEGRLSITDC